MKVLKGLNKRFALYPLYFIQKQWFADVFKIGVFKKFAVFTGKLCFRVSF